MPNPKRRHSKARGRKRRTHYKAPAMSVCSNCGEMKLNHSVCPSCGFYDGKSVVLPKKS